MPENESRKGRREFIGRALPWRVQRMGSRWRALLVAIIAAIALVQFFTGGLLTLASTPQSRQEVHGPGNDTHKTLNTKQFRVSKAGYSKKWIVPSIAKIPGEHSGFKQIARLEPTARVAMTALPNLPLKDSAPKIVTAPDTVDLAAAFKERVEGSRGTS